MSRFLFEIKNIEIKFKTLLIKNKIMDMPNNEFELFKEEWKETRNSIARFDTISVDLRKYGFSLISTIITASVFFLGTKQPESLLPIVLAPASIMILICGLFLADMYNEVLLLGCVIRAKNLESISQKFLTEKSETQLYPRLYLTTFLEASVQTIKARSFTLIIYVMFVGANVSLGISYLFYYRRKIDDEFFVYYLFGFIGFSGFIAYFLYLISRKKNSFVNEKTVVFDELVVEKIFEPIEIAKKIDELSLSIKEYIGDDFKILTIGEGGLSFARKLIRQFNPNEAQTIEILSVFTTKDDNNKIVIIPPKKESLANKRVLIVDDLAASGKTIKKLKDICQECEAKEVRVCVLLDAPEKRESQFKDLVINYRGLTTIEKDGYFIGQGMDYEGRCREAQFIGILKNKG